MTIFLFQFGNPDETKKNKVVEYTQLQDFIAGGNADDNNLSDLSLEDHEDRTHQIVHETLVNDLLAMCYY